MHIEKMYKIKENGIIKITCKIQKSSEVLEELNILVAEENMDLIRISDNENVGGSIWLKDNDTQDNYQEEKAASTLSDTELYITDSDDDA